jgi:hypothetical protein
VLAARDEGDPDSKRSARTRSVRFASRTDTAHTITYAATYPHTVPSTISLVIIINDQCTHLLLLITTRRGSCSHNDCCPARGGVAR